MRYSIGVILVLWCGFVWAHENHVTPERKSQATQTSIFIDDTALQDHTRMERHLRSDVIGDRIAVIDFIYTSCTTMCPMVSSVMARLQKDLGERLEREVILVSVSVDPVRDTPEKLAAHARKFDQGKGWVWLTGSRYNVQEVLRNFGITISNLEEHAPMVMVGRADNSNWYRLVGIPHPDDVMEALTHFQRP